MAVSTRTRGLVVGAIGVVAAAAVVMFGLERSERVTGTVEIISPTHAELETAAGLRVFFAHQSVGSNILTGIPPVFADAGMASPVVTESREPPAGDGAFFAHAHIGVNGDPFGKLVEFASIVDGSLGDHVDVALLKLCYADIVASTDVDAVFSAFVATMDELSERHPDVRFLYATVPVTTDPSWKQTVKSWLGMNDQMGPADNVARQRYNTLIRQKYGNTGRLFDIAAVESTLGQTPMTRDYHGEPYVVLNRVLASDGGHLNELGSKAAAAELIRLLAATTAP